MSHTQPGWGQSSIPTSRQHPLPLVRAVRTWPACGPWTRAGSAELPLPALRDGSSTATTAGRGSARAGPRRPGGGRRPGTTRAWLVPEPGWRLDRGRKRRTLVGLDPCLLAGSPRQAEGGRAVSAWPYMVVPLGTSPPPPEKGRGTSPRAARPALPAAFAQQCRWRESGQQTRVTSGTGGVGVALDAALLGRRRLFQGVRGSFPSPRGSRPALTRWASL